MKKFAAIALVLFFLAIPLAHLGKGVFIKDKGAESIKRSKKTVVISDIPSELYSKQTLSGDWVLFLHYPEETSSADITMDADGTVYGKDKNMFSDMKTSIDKEGIIMMKNDKISMEGIINTEANHISGMASVSGIRAPVPFSAFKIDSPGKEKP